MNSAFLTIYILKKEKIILKFNNLLKNKKNTG